MMKSVSAKDMEYILIHLYFIDSYDGLAELKYIMSEDKTYIDENIVNFKMIMYSN